MASNTSTPFGSVQKGGSRKGKKVNYSQVFVKDDVPVSFYLMDEELNHVSDDFMPLSEVRVAKLTKLIEKHGGIVCDTIEDSRVIIVNEQAVARYAYFYRFTAGVDVEPPGFISACIHNNEYSHWRPDRFGMGGKPKDPTKPPRARRPFTAQHDQFLARHIALLIPENGAGGRMGNKIYKELEAQAWAFDTGDYVIGRDHTWHSWRERYKKNPEYFAELIAQILAQDDKLPDDKVLYQLDRRLSKQRRVTQARVDDSEAEAEAAESGADEADGVDEDEFGSDSQPHRRKRHARDSNDPDADYRPSSSKRVRKDEEEDPEEEQDGFEAELIEEEDAEYDRSNQPGPSGIQRTPTPSPGPSRRANESEQLSEQATVPAAVSSHRPKPRPITRQTVPVNSQETLVNATQRSPEKRTTNQQELEHEHEHEVISEPRSGQPAAQNKQSNSDGSSPRRRSGTRVEVLLRRIQDIRSTSTTGAKLRLSEPPVATLAHSSQGVDNEAEDDIESEEVDQLDQTTVSETPRYNTRGGRSGALPRKNMTFDENAAKEEEEKEETDEESQVDVFLSQPAADSESESDLKAQRNLQNAESDLATSSPRQLRRSRRQGQK
ncbi:hypothetical protein BDY19DRAFT_902508 [Irpex rosettiformis]|uniref:Uncharacterized protein n=1 Tax=Irpex rosettiformis TaxID=378272 RepID=A0ACB8UH67_9APHY|nr:hypothetical protein BDY19DRAFT_902508 [Irpex rosettiformis]